MLDHQGESPPDIVIENAFEAEDAPEDGDNELRNRGEKTSPEVARKGKHVMLNVEDEKKGGDRTDRSDNFSMTSANTFASEGGRRKKIKHFSLQDLNRFHSSFLHT